MERKSFKVPIGLKRFFRYTWIYFAIATVLGIGGFGIIDLLFPTPAVPLNFSWDGILMFMGISAGIGWMLHGTGFLLVRVK